MNVESVQITRQVLIMKSSSKSAKMESKDESFLQVYSQSIKGSEQNSKLKNSSENVLSQLNATEQKNLDEVDCADELINENLLNSDISNPLAMLLQMNLRENQQLNVTGVSSNEVLENASQMNTLEPNTFVSESNTDDKVLPLPENIILSKDLINQNPILSPELSKISSSVVEQIDGNETIVESVVSKIGLTEVVLSDLNMQRISDAIYKLQQATRQSELGKVKVTLDPIELGNVDVIVQVEDGKWMTRILVENEPLKQAIANKLVELSDPFIKQNIKIETVHINESHSEVKSPFVETAQEFTVFKNETQIGTYFDGKSSIEVTTAPPNLLKGEELRKTTSEDSLVIGEQITLSTRENTIKPVSVPLQNQTDLSEENLNKVNDTIIKLMETTTEGKTSVMKVRLYPEEMGSVDVMLKYEDGKLIAKILVENEQVKQMFSNKINELNDNLIKQNINLEKVQIDVNANSNFSGNLNQEKNHQFKKNHRFTFDSESVESITAEETSTSTSEISILA